LIFLACGVWLVGLGGYFALLRPALLPEDPQFIGSSLAQIQSAVPGMERWLNQGFIVMGGFIVASGLLTIFLAVTAVAAREKGTGMVLLLTGLATVVTMSWTNFAIITRSAGTSSQQPGRTAWSGTRNTSASWPSCSVSCCSGRLC
jgi:hypothetical protein